MDLESALDLATAKLAIELQLADIDDLLDSLYDTEDLPEGDARTSFEIIKTDFQEELLTLEVKILSLSISKAEHDSRQTCSRIRQEEAQAGNDYQFARRLAQTCVVDEEQAADDHRLAMRLAAVSVSNRNQIASDHRLALQLSEVGASDDGTKRSTTPPANPFYSATNAFQVNGDHVPNNNRREQCDMAKNPGPIVLNRPLPERALSNDIHLSKACEVNPSTRSTNTCSDTTFTCCACSEDVSTKNSITLACKPEAHVYCHGCLVDFFKTAVHDTEQFPPRCCKVPLPIDKCRAFLPQDLIKTFNAKVEELATPNPTYCSNTTCAEFIRPKDIEAGLGKCPKCMTNTCTTCKDAEHKGLCEFDPQTHQLLDLAERRKFQTCSKCNNMVELSTGCFHIKCRCKHEFCYLCGKKWKTCKCAQADENFLTRPIPPAQVNVPTHNRTALYTPRLGTPRADDAILTRPVFPAPVTLSQNSSPAAHTSRPGAPGASMSDVPLLDLDDFFSDETERFAQSLNPHDYMFDDFDDWD